MDFDKNDKEEMKKAGRLVRVGGILVVIALIGLLVLGLGSCGGSDKEKMQHQLDSLKLANEKLQLTGEYENLNKEFQLYENQAQYLQNDSLLEQYAQAKDKVEKLLAELKTERSTNRKRIQELQNEISTLRGLLRHYVSVIDSLGKENSALRNMNEELQSRNQQLSTTVSDYTEKNQLLSERMELAEKLNLTGLHFQALNKKGKTRRKSARQSSCWFLSQSRKTIPRRWARKLSMCALSVRKAQCWAADIHSRLKAEMWHIRKKKQ